MANISKWKCIPYAGDNVTIADVPIPYALRCWGNQYHRGSQTDSNSCTRNCASHTSTKKYSGWSDGSGNHYNKFKYAAYNCNANRGKNTELLSLLNHPVLSANIATTNQINEIRLAINAEIDLRQQNPTYQNNKTSYVTIEKTTLNTVNSEELPDLPATPVASPANQRVTTNHLMYKDLLSTLESYIKLADKETTINQLGNGPSTETIDFSSNNIIQASDENTLTSIYAATYQDCICYSDCNQFAVCWCYSNCNDY